jgi:Flp pilus assembly secretin CpaC
MSLAFGRIGPRGRRNALAAAFVAAIGAWSPAAADRSPADRIIVLLDEAQVMGLPDRVATLIIGNPLIADVSIQAGNVLVVTGKGYGVTNMLMLDRTGSVLLQKTIQVEGPRDSVVVVYRGVERESYSCTPKCERRITLGDSPAYFDAVIGQTTNRNGQAQGGISSK